MNSPSRKRNNNTSSSVGTNIPFNINSSASSNSTPSRKRNNKTNMNSLFGKTVSPSRFF